MDYISEQTIHEIVQKIKDELFIGVEASGRHVHLSQKDLNSLFGEGYQLTPVKDLSQPGQYACKERISVTGSKGTIHNVIILGPVRAETQIEVSLTDALTLGIKAPIRQSGDVAGTPGTVLSNGDKKITIERGVIAAKRHVHMTPEDADKFHLKDKEIIKLKVFGSRPLIFEDVVLRVSKDFKTFAHIDYDEANACGFTNGTKGIIIK